MKLYTSLSLCTKNFSGGDLGYFSFLKSLSNGQLLNASTTFIQPYLRSIQGRTT